MKRLRMAGVAVAVSVVLGGCVQSGAPGPLQAGQPHVQVPAQSDALQAFHGLGKLAFVRDGKLWILDGETDTLQQTDAQAGNPTWSADGTWLALVAGDGSDRRLLLVEAATGKAQEFSGLPGPVEGYAWAPTGHRLAVGAGDGIWRVEEPAGGKPERLATVATAAGGLAWSPDGARIAFVRTLPWDDPLKRTSVLEVLVVGSGQVSAWYQADRAGLGYVDWWPDGQGVIFWSWPQWCNSCSVDGLPLQSLPLGEGKPVQLPIGLPSRDWLSWSPGGPEIVMVKGVGRFISVGKGLAACNVKTGACRDLPQPADAVSLDPSWSPDGSRIALVRAQNWKAESSVTPDMARGWVESRRLWITNADGSGAHEVTAAGGGVYGPAWARDGRHLIYVKDGALWVLDVQEGRVQRVVSLGDARIPVEFWYRSGWPYQMAWYQPE